MLQKIIYFAFAITVFSACQNSPKPKRVSYKYNMYVGTYTKHEGHVEGKAKGIYHILLDDSLNIVSESVITDVVNPSYITLSHNGKFLYSVEETAPTGMVKVFDIQSETPKLIGKASSEGAAPCFIDINENDSYLTVANYGGSTIAFPLATDGSFGAPMPSISFSGKGPTARQESSHAHSAQFLPKHLDRFFVNDLGTDQTHVMEIGGNGQLRIVDNLMEQDSAGPRHSAFHPSATPHYVLNELNSTVSAWIDNRKAQTISTLPKNYKDRNLCADIHITPDGRFLYATNRFHNSVAIFGIDSSTFLLSFLGTEPSHGEIPRNFNITPDGKYLFCANQNSDNIIVFSINDNGSLTYKKEIKVMTPVCLKFGA